MKRPRSEVRCAERIAFLVMDCARLHVRCTTKQASLQGGFARHPGMGCGDVRAFPDRRDSAESCRQRELDQRRVTQSTLVPV